MDILALTSIENLDQEGIQITTLMQFSAPESAPDGFLEHWIDLTQDEKKFQNPNVTEEIPKCEKLLSLKGKIAPEIWTESELDDDFQPEIGDIVNLKCPPGWKLSFDNDTMDSWDDLFSVTCTASQIYSVSNYFPGCVGFCDSCLPEAPDVTGLVPVTPPNTIPIGGFGQYVCAETELGVDEVKPTENFVTFSLNTCKYFLFL